jgi:hypothetical protein
VVVAAALTDRRWLLPVAVVLAMPVVWLNSLAVLAACPALVGMDRDRRASRGTVHPMGDVGLRFPRGSQA